MPSLSGGGSGQLPASVVSASSTGGVSAWAPTTVYAVNALVTNGGNTYICLVAHTSGGSFTGIGTNWQLFGAPLASPAFTGSPTAPTAAAGDSSTKLATTAFAASAAATPYSVLGALYGIDPSTGLPNAPWKLEQARGANMWNTANFSNNNGSAEGTSTNNLSSLTPFVTGPNGGGAVWTLTRVKTPTVVPNGDANGAVLRVTLTVTTAGTLGANLYLRMRGYDGAAFVTCLDDSGNLPAGGAVNGQVQYTFNSTVLAPSGNPLRISCDFDYSAVITGAGLPTYFDIQLGSDGGTANNGATLQVSNVVIQVVDGATPRMRASWTASNGGTNSAASLQLDCVFGRDAVGRLIRGRQTWGADNALPLGYLNTVVFYDQSLPGFLSQVGVTGRSYPTAQLNTNNNDITMNVYKADGVTTEFRGNTHGGEAGATGTYSTDAQVFLDYGDGNGWTGPYLAQNSGEFYRNCVRAKIVVNTSITRSDQGSPYCSIVKTYYVYGDGTIRYDRTLTWLQDQKVAVILWYMLSNSPAGTGTVASTRWRGGAGESVLGKVDQAAYIAPPALSAVPTVATTGGSIPSVPGSTFYSVKVTALDATGGESMPGVINSLVTVPTGSANTLAASWGAVSGATAYAVYFGLPGSERRVATTTSTTYTILGSEVPGQLLPTKSTANSGQGAYQQMLTGKADWVTFLDPVTNVAMASTLNRAAIQAFTGGVSGVSLKVLLQPGVFSKMYWQMQFAGSDYPATVPNGTVWTDTAWAYFYMPADPVNFEKETAVRSVAQSLLPNSLYPAT